MGGVFAPSLFFGATLGAAYDGVLHSSLGLDFGSSSSYAVRCVRDRTQRIAHIHTPTQRLHASTRWRELCAHCRRSNWERLSEMLM